MFQFIQSGRESSDCTTPYKVILDKDYSVFEFIKAVLTNKDDEWGYIEIKDQYHLEPFGRPTMEYRYGVSFGGLGQYLDAKVKSATASGGWSRMDYILEVESNA